MHAVDTTLHSRDQLLQTLKDRMVVAQHRLKQQADKHRSEREFNVGDWVFLKLHPYRQQSLVKRPSHKLSPRFYGPFKIEARIGKVAYQLQLPPSSKIHPTFHVSLLKKRIGDDIPVSPTLPPFDDQGEIIWTPAAVLDMCVIKKKKRSVTMWLIQWVGLPKEDATWEPAHTIAARFPTFGARGQAPT